MILFYLFINDMTDLLLRIEIIFMTNKYYSIPKEQNFHDYNDIYNTFFDIIEYSLKDLLKM